MTHKKPSNHGKTTLVNENTLQRAWFILDAKGKTLGRFSSEVAKVLRGKHKPSFNPAGDCGDGVIVINADKIKVSGNKQAQKLYYHHTGGMRGLREVPFEVMKDRKPGMIITHAVKGMIPKTKLGRKLMKRLRVFAGEEHDLKAQQPINVSI